MCGSMTYEDGARFIRRVMLENSGIGKRYRGVSLSDFEPKEGQEEAHAAAKAFYEDYMSGKNRGEGMLFAGNCGSGKTILAAAIGCEVIANIELDEVRIGYAAMFGEDFKRCGEYPVKFVNAVDLLERLRNSFDKGNGESRGMLEEYEAAPLLILDDLGAEKPSGWSGERLYELINYRYTELLPTIITTNCHADELRSRLGERIFDRIRSTCSYHAITSAVSLRR